MTTSPMGMLAVSDCHSLSITLLNMLGVAGILGMVSMSGAPSISSMPSVPSTSGLSIQSGYMDDKKDTREGTSQQFLPVESVESGSA